MRWALVQDHTESWYGVLRWLLLIKATFDLLKPLLDVMSSWGLRRGLPICSACALLRRLCQDIKWDSSTSHHCPTLAFLHASSPGKDGGKRRLNDAQEVPVSLTTESHFC